MGVERELAEAFAPCTLGGLLDALYEMNVEIGKRQRERDNVQAILLAASVKSADMDVEPAFRKGGLIEGEKRKAQAIWRLVEGAPHQRWEPKLTFIREDVPSG